LRVTIFVTGNILSQISNTCKCPCVAKQAFWILFSAKQMGLFTRKGYCQFVIILHLAKSSVVKRLTLSHSQAFKLLEIVTLR